MITLHTNVRAAVPEGWSNPAPVDPLEALALLAGGPLLLFALVTLAVYLPALARGERVRPGQERTESVWFGGPRQGIEAADRVAADRLSGRQLEGGRSEDGPSEGRDTGGAHGQW